MPVLPRFTSARSLVRPSVGDYLIVELPGERMRCVVDKVIDRDRVIVEIASVPMAKSHTYRKGDMTGARRRREHGLDRWEAIDDRDFIANRSPNEFLPATEEKPKRKRGAA